MLPAYESMRKKLVIDQISIEDQLEKQERNIKLLQTLLIWRAKTVDCEELLLK